MRSGNNFSWTWRNCGSREIVGGLKWLEIEGRLSSKRLLSQTSDISNELSQFSKNRTNKDSLVAWPQLSCRSTSTAGQITKWNVQMRFYEQHFSCCAYETLHVQLPPVVFKHSTLCTEIGICFHKPSARREKENIFLVRSSLFGAIKKGLLHFTTTCRSWQLKQKQN